MSDANPDEVVPQDGHTLEEWRALGSAEANAWTITPPGGQPMTLSEHAVKVEKEQAANDSAEFRAMTFMIDGEPMSFEELQKHNAASDSAEIQATTFVIDGIPMSMNEMVEYRATKSAEKAARDERDAEAQEEMCRCIEEDYAAQRKQHAEFEAEHGFPIHEMMYSEVGDNLIARLRTQDRHQEADAAVKYFANQLIEHKRELIADGRDPETGLKNTCDSDML